MEGLLTVSGMEIHLTETAKKELFGSLD